MSLYSVKVSLKLRAGVAQRPIFASDAQDLRDGAGNRGFLGYDQVMQSIGSFLL